MIINKMENGIWTSIDTERKEVLCTIESLGNHIYKATNSFLKIPQKYFLLMNIELMLNVSKIKTELRMGYIENQGN